MLRFEQRISKMSSLKNVFFVLFALGTIGIVQSDCSSCPSWECDEYSVQAEHYSYTSSPSCEAGQELYFAIESSGLGDLALSGVYVTDTNPYYFTSLQELEDNSVYRQEDSTSCLEATVSAHHNALWLVLVNQYVWSDCTGNFRVSCFAPESSSSSGEFPPEFSSSESEDGIPAVDLGDLWDDFQMLFAGSGNEALWCVDTRI
jgi:hypothetical protein